MMTNENLSYNEALLYKKNYCYSSIFNYSDIVNKQSPSSHFIKPYSPALNENYPILNDRHHFFNSKKPKAKIHHAAPLVKHFSPLPRLLLFS